jgi:hypothetical protein
MFARRKRLDRTSAPNSKTFVYGIDVDTIAQGRWFTFSVVQFKWKTLQEE